METKSKLNLSRRILLALTLVFFQSFAFGQNMIANSSFEDGIQVCPNSGNLSNWIAGGTVYSWAGRNILYPNLNYNTGNVWDDNSAYGSCAFPSGFSAYDGDRAISITINWENNVYQGSEVASLMSGALSANLCYSLCMSLSGMGISGDQNIIEVVAISNSNAASPKVLATFNVGPSLGWQKFSKNFRLSSQGGIYDVILLRHKQTGGSDYDGHVFIDAVNLAPCGNIAEVANDPGFTYNVESFDGIGPIVAGSGDPAELGVHHWDIYGGNEDDPNASWTLIPEHSVTSTDANFTSDNLGTLYPYFMVTHALASPCGLTVCKAAIFSARGSMGNTFNPSTCTFVPVGDEYEEEEVISSGLADPKSSALFTLSPNPAKEEIVITPAFKVSGKTHMTAIVMNAAGQVVIKNEGFYDQSKINLSGLSKGLYFVKITSGNKSCIKKFIKE